MPGDELAKTLDELHRAETISEVLLLSTCNRIEVYADVARFHPAVAEISSVLARHAGLPVGDLAEHLYVHFAEAAAEHMFSVASGLDSMVVGESQILGQLRAAYALGTEAGSIGSVLHDLAQIGAAHRQAGAHRDRHRPGRRVDRVRRARPRGLGARAADGLRAVIVGAGSMGALAGATLRRRAVESTSWWPTAAPSGPSGWPRRCDARAVGLGDLAAVDRRRRPADLLDRRDRARRRGRDARRPLAAGR